MSASPSIPSNVTDAQPRLGSVPQRPPDWVLERIRTTLQYDPESGWLTWIVQRMRIKAGTRAGTVWTSPASGRKVRKICFGRGTKEVFVKYEHHVAWFLHTGEWPEMEIDHKDRDATNNKWDNLRLCTPVQQRINYGLRRNNTSGAQGVFWRERDKSFSSKIVANYKIHNLGTFKTFEKAKAAYAAARLMYHDNDFLPNDVGG